MYATIPLFKFDTNIDLALQENVSDLMYGVFYAPSSPFVKSSGKAEKTMKTACLKAIRKTVGAMESLPNYKLTKVSLKQFYVNGTSVHVSIAAGTDETTINKTIIVRS